MLLFKTFIAKNCNYSVQGRLYHMCSVAHRALFACLGDARFVAFCPLVSTIVRGFLSVSLSALALLTVHWCFVWASYGKPLMIILKNMWDFEQFGVVNSRVRCLLIKKTIVRHHLEEGPYLIFWSLSPRCSSVFILPWMAYLKLESRWRACSKAIEAIS